MVKLPNWIIRTDIMVTLYSGGRHEDDRGLLLHNNQVDFSRVKRSYLIQNKSIELIRGWRGHQIESRWFICVAGQVRVWVTPLSELPVDDIHALPFYDMSESSYDCLVVPPGYATAFQSLLPSSKLQCFSDYAVGEVEDDYLFPII